MSDERREVMLNMQLRSTVPRAIGGVLEVLLRAAPGDVDLQRRILEAAAVLLPLRESGYALLDGEVGLGCDSPSPAPSEDAPVPHAIIAWDKGRVLNVGCVNGDPGTGGQREHDG